uniref:Endonuclease/exonuclease/phosphatase domain-containing protein n=1 Tax=Salmo trutta TaxID=8032 RepID=A0A673W1Y0_SALTR
MGFLTSSVGERVAWVCGRVRVLCKRILNYLKQRKVDIALIQETHLNVSKHGKLKREGVPLSLIIKGGRFLIIQGSINTEIITIVNVYRPNHDDPAFYQDIFLKLTCPSSEIIMAGDFNLVLNPSCDRSSSNSINLTQTAKIFVLRTSRW